MRLGARALQSILTLLIVGLVQNQALADDIAGFIRQFGPLVGCEASIDGIMLPSAVSKSFRTQVAANSSGWHQLLFSPSPSCIDIFTRLPLTYHLSSALLQSSATTAVGLIPFTAYAYLDLINPVKAPITPDFIRTIVNNLYNFLGIYLSSYGLDPLSLDPRSMLNSQNGTIRALGVAVLAAEVELNAVIGVITTGIKAYGTPNNAAAPAILPRAVAAATMAMLPQRPPSAWQSTPALSGIISDVWSKAAIMANYKWLAVHANVVPVVVIGIAQYAEALKRVAQRQADWEYMGLNPLNAVITLAKLSVVVQTSTFPLADTGKAYAFATTDLPTHISQAAVDLDAIHTAFNLAPPAASVAPAYAIAHWIGPLSSCRVASDGLWDPQHEESATGTAGDTSLSAKGLGSVTVPAAAGCRDGLTGLPVGLSVYNLGPAATAVSVSPVGMLAQAVYNLAANGGLASPNESHQAAAFQAVGLDMASYTAAMFQQGGSGPAQTYFDLSNPFVTAIIAANTQLVGLLAVSRAMFGRSCLWAYGFDWLSNYTQQEAAAEQQTVAVTLYVTAQMAALQYNGDAYLSSADTIQYVLAWVASHCRFNYSSQYPGTLFTGGPAASVGAIPTHNTSGHRHRLLRTESETHRTSHLDEDGMAAAAAGKQHLEAASGASGAHTPPSIDASHYSTGAPLRWLHADLVARGVLGPYALMPVEEELDLDLDSRRLLSEAAEGKDPPRTGLRSRRQLGQFSPDEDGDAACKLVVMRLAEINRNLSNLQTTLTVQTNLERSLLAVDMSKLAYLLQISFYTEIKNAMNSQWGSTLLPLITLVDKRYSGAELQQRIAETRLQSRLICDVSPSNCALPPSPQPSPPPPPPPSPPPPPDSRVVPWEGYSSGFEDGPPPMIVFILPPMGAFILFIMCACVCMYMRNRSVQRAASANQAPMTVSGDGFHSVIYGGGRVQMLPISGGVGTAATATGTPVWTSPQPGDDPQPVMGYPVACPAGIHGGRHRGSGHHHHHNGRGGGDVGYIAAGAGGGGGDWGGGGGGGGGGDGGFSSGNDGFGGGGGFSSGNDGFGGGGGGGGGFSSNND